MPQQQMPQQQARAVPSQIPMPPSSPLPQSPWAAPAPTVPGVPADAWAELDWTLSQIEATDALWARAIRRLQMVGVNDPGVFGDIAAAVLHAFEPGTLSYQALIEWSRSYMANLQAPQQVMPEVDAGYFSEPMAPQVPRVTGRVVRPYETVRY